MNRTLSEKQIKALLKHVSDDDLDNLLWVVQKFAAAGLNQRHREAQCGGGN